MNELLLRQVDEVRRNLNGITKKLKAVGKSAGKGAAELSAVLGGVTLKLAKAQALKFYDPAADDAGDGA